MQPLGGLEPAGVAVWQKMTRRFYCGAFAALLAVESFIALFVHDSFVRPYLGDVLVIVLLYCLGRGVLGIRGKWLAPAVTALGALAEGLQYLHLADRLDLPAASPLRIILGSTFDWADLLCYLAGGLILAVWEMKAERHKGAVIPSHSLERKGDGNKKAPPGSN